MVFECITLKMSSIENEICNALKICEANECDGKYQLIHSRAHSFSN